VLNSSRSALRRRRTVLSGGLAALASDQGSGDQSAAESAVLGEEERRAVIAALRRLPRRQREVLVLRFYLDQTETQIAAQLGIGQSTVRSSGHRGLKSLARILKELS
jgi:RNA polymerase sigma factor (sigma-70 family)